MSDYVQRLVARTQAPAIALRPAAGRSGRDAETADPFENPRIAPEEAGTDAADSAGGDRAPRVAGTLLPVQPDADLPPPVPRAYDPGRGDEGRKARDPTPPLPAPPRTEQVSSRVGPRERSAAEPPPVQVRVERPALAPPPIPAAISIPARREVPLPGPAPAPVPASPSRAGRAEVRHPQGLEPLPGAPPSPATALAPEPRISIGRITVEVVAAPRPRPVPSPLAPRRPDGQPPPRPAARDEGGSLNLRFGLGQI